MKDAEKIVRLQSIVKRAVNLLNDATSGYISGSQHDKEWDIERGLLVTEARNLLNEVK